MSLKHCKTIFIIPSTTLDCLRRNGEGQLKAFQRARGGATGRKRWMTLFLRRALRALMAISLLLEHQNLPELFAGVKRGLNMLKHA